MRKIENPTDTPTECELEDIAADIQKRNEEREQREGEEEAQKQKEERQRKESMKEETNYSAEEGVAERHARTDRRDTEMEIEGWGEAGTLTFQAQEGGYDKHLLNRLKWGDYCGYCQALLGALQDQQTL